MRVSAYSTVRLSGLGTWPESSRCTSRVSAVVESFPPDQATAQ
jgi:hypothetical protein